MNKSKRVRALERKLDTNSINHVLHLILTLLTAGLWVFVWIFLALITPSDASIISKIDRLEEIDNENS